MFRKAPEVGNIICIFLQTKLQGKDNIPNLKSIAQSWKSSLTDPWRLWVISWTSSGKCWTGMSSPLHCPGEGINLDHTIFFLFPYIIFGGTMTRSRLKQQSCRHSKCWFFCGVISSALNMLLGRTTATFRNSIVVWGIISSSAIQSLLLPLGRNTN